MKLYFLGVVLLQLTKLGNYIIERYFTFVSLLLLHFPRPPFSLDFLYSIFGIQVFPFFFRQVLDTSLLH